MKHLMHISHWETKVEITLAVLMLSILCFIITWGVELVAGELFRFW